LHLLCSSKKSAVDSKKCWGWDLFHLKRPLVAIIQAAGKA
jgi:hypothetical protein